MRVCVIADSLMAMLVCAAFKHKLGRAGRAEPPLWRPQ
jgi:hypothetical protein